MNFRSTPVYAERYKSLIKGRVDSGPAFKFPEAIARPQSTVSIKGMELLNRHFTGWTEGEIPGRTPIVGVFENGHAVSVCCCSRRSDVAAEAGLETAEAYRGRGLGPQVAAAWAWPFGPLLVHLYTAHHGAMSPAVCRPQAGLGNVRQCMEYLSGLIGDRVQLRAVALACSLRDHTTLSTQKRRGNRAAHPDRPAPRPFQLGARSPTPPMRLSRPRRRPPPHPAIPCRSRRCPRLGRVSRYLHVVRAGFELKHHGLHRARPGTVGELGIAAGYHAPDADPCRPVAHGHLVGTLF